MRTLTVADIPQISENPIRMPRKERDEPLIAAWAKRHEAEQTSAMVRTLDIYDVHGPARMSFDDLLDLEEDRERRVVKQFYWSVPKSVAHYADAKRDAYLIMNFYESAVALRGSRYQHYKQRLLDAGYALDVIASVPEPPAEVVALHMVNGCTGETHYYRDKISGTLRRVCHGCHRIFVGAYSKQPSMDDLEYNGPVLIPQNPDYEWYVDQPEDDFASQEEKQRGLAVMRRVLKIHGSLLSVSEAAEMLNVTTQNFSNNYIAKRRLRSWPDPDDSRYRVVLRYEVEKLVRR